MNTGVIIPISDKLYLINSPTEGRFPMAFSFLVLGTETHAIIDTGCGKTACRSVMETYGVDLVINSHCHPDHVSGNHIFKEKELLVPRERVEESGAVSRLAFRLLGPDKKRMDLWSDFVRRQLGMRDYKATGTYKDGDVLEFGGVSLQAVHTPGHLDDHYCFWEPDQGLLLTFDMDMTEFGPFYGNPESDIHVFRNSIDRVLELHPKAAVSSHRMPVREDAGGEIRRFGEKFDRNEKRIAGLLAAPRTLEEICTHKPFYGRHPSGMKMLYEFFERNMVQKHLEIMEREGRVVADNGRYRMV